MIKNLPSIVLFLFMPMIAMAQLTIIVDDIPNNTPEDDPIHIAGDFQGWNPGNPNHQLIKDSIQNILHITLSGGIGDIQFKFTRGNWGKVESDENGNYIPNRFYSPTDGDTIKLQILGWEDLDGNGGGISTAAENVSVITDSFPIPQLNRYRRIWIYLPPDYETSHQYYPVLYMHDGQNLFDNLTSYIGEWEVDETLNDLHERGDPGIIVVGIDNGQGRRIHEYSPWDNTSYNARGKGGLYVDFIVDDLKPFIDTNYRTLPDRENTGIMGSSLGGSISTYAAIENQDIFSKVGAFSPAYWFNPEIFNNVIAKGKQHDMMFFQIAGSLEGVNYVNNMFAMQDSLLAAGFGREEIVTLEKPDGEHSEWFWAREFEAAYLWLFRSGSLSIEEKKLNSDNFTLYPNPVDDILVLKFKLIDSKEVRIEIFDSTGSVNKSLYANTLQAGRHSLKFNLKKRQLPPGIYVCRIHSGDEVKSLRFVIAR